MNQYTAQDFKKGQPRWCPGCGDHFFLASLQKAMAELGVPPTKQPLSVVSDAQTDYLIMLIHTLSDHSWSCSSHLYWGKGDQPKPYYPSGFRAMVTHLLSVVTTLSMRCVVMWTEYDSFEQPYLWSNEGTVFTNQSTWLRF